MKSCCFTGHRIINLPNKELKPILNNCIIKAVNENGYNHFICGGSVGFDMLAAELVIDLKKNNNITLEIAIPFPKHDKTWNEEEKQRFTNILKGADKKTNVSNIYYKSCFQCRNQYMVDNSSLVIAYFDGSKGGTKNTIDYAKRKNKQIINIAK